MPKPANLLLATLRARLKSERDPLECEALRGRIKALAADLAKREYEAKSAPLRRELAGAY